MAGAWVEGTEGRVEGNGEEGSVEEGRGGGGSEF